MTRVSNLSMWLIACIVLGAFSLAALFFPYMEIWESVNAAAMSLCAGCMVGYLRPAWQAIRLPVKQITAAQGLIIGIVACSASLTVNFCILWIWRAWDKPDWLIDGWALLLSRFLFIGGAFIVLATVGAADNEIGIQSYRRAGIIAAVSVAISSAVISFGWFP